MPNTATDKPNVLLICTDHMPALLMRPMGHPVCMTPTLETLARNGVTYTNAYSTCPSCIPARRSLMSGMNEYSHGATANQPGPMPNVPTLAQRFRDVGYQAFAVGKLHVVPQRDRIGFDDVILCEEGRLRDDDWEQYISDRGYHGQAFGSGMTNNDYLVRPWQLPEDCHPTNWTASQMCRTIVRRDPTKPAFWYMSFIAPHPPIWPLPDYLSMYQNVAVDKPVMGDWASDPERLPPALLGRNAGNTISGATQGELDLALRGFYATVTHIDHQIRLVIGTLREQGLLDNTIIAFTSDHGDMLGDHGLWAKGLFYQKSAQVPMLVVLPPGDERARPGERDDRLMGLYDVMPTLLDAAGIAPPDDIDGVSALSARRETLFGISSRGDSGSAMLHDGRLKLIYYGQGNRVQLFDTVNDPRDEHDLANDPAHQKDVARLSAELAKRLDGPQKCWVNEKGELVGVPIKPVGKGGARTYGRQRGLHFA